MKILYLHQYFTTPEMIGGTRSYEMARRLVRAGHEVHMVTSWRESDGGRSDWFSEDVAGIRVHWLPVPYSPHMSYSRRIRAFLRFAFSAGSRAASIGADVVFATSTPLTIAIPAVRASRVLKVPLVFEVRDLWPEVPIAIGALTNPVTIYLARRLERYAYSNSTRIVALSPGMKVGVVAAGYPAGNVSVIPNSADLDLFRPGAAGVEAFLDTHPELRGRRIIMYAGTLGKVNGVGYLARVAHAAKQAGSDLAFAVVGEGPERDEVLSLGRELGVLDANFFVFDSVPKVDVADAFRAADILLSLCIDLPELQANSANKFFDALSSGRPIAINYEGWQADIIRRESVGLVLGPDPAEAARMLIDACADPEMLDEAGTRARALAERDFSRDLLAAQLEQVLLDAVEDSGRALNKTAL